MRLTIWEEAALPPEVDARIRAALAAAFPADAAVFARTRAWHGSAPAFTLLLETQEGKVAAHLGVVEREVCFGSEAVRIGGLQNVFVATPFRGQGLARRLLAAAGAEMRRRGADAGLLFCKPALEPLYARNGWATLPGQMGVRVDAVGAEHPLDSGTVVMFLPLKRATPPEGVLHLCGNDW